MESNLINKFIQRTGLKRIKVSQRGYQKVEDIRVIVCLGDIPSVIAASRLFDGFDIGKYNVLLTFPGMEGIFENVDEIITFEESFPYLRLHDEAEGIVNSADSVRQIKRSLNEYFINVSDITDFIKSYGKTINFNITEKNNLVLNNWDWLKNVANLQPKNRSVVLIPWKKHRTLFKSESIIPVLLSENIYKEIIKILVENRYQVTCIQNQYTFTMPNLFSKDKVNYVKEESCSKIIQTIRENKCLFSFFDNVSVLGYMAQVPVFTIAERSYYMKTMQDLESFIFDCTSHNGCKFSFYSSFFDDRTLNVDYVSNIIDRFIEFYDQMVFNYDKQYLSAKEIDFLPYLEICTKRKNAKFISKFIKKKEEEKYAQG